MDSLGFKIMGGPNGEGGIDIPLSPPNPPLLKLFSWSFSSKTMKCSDLVRIFDTLSMPVMDKVILSPGWKINVYLVKKGTIFWKLKWIGFYLGLGIESKKSIKSIFRKIEKIDFFQPIFSIFSIRKIDLKM